MREWIVTNGLGGYASLTNRNTNTRKYHGLLVASLNPPTERWVFVTNILDKIKVDQELINLNGLKNDFSFEYFPLFNYDINDIKIKKTVLMENGKNTTVLKYKIITKKPITFIHNILINSRHFYDINNQRYLSFKHEINKDFVSVKPSNIDKTINIFLKDAEFEPLHYWEELFYEQDRKRNESWIDNNVHVGRFRKEIKKSCEYYLAVSLENEKDINPTRIYSDELHRKKDLIQNTNLNRQFQKLILSSDNFIVNKGLDKTIIAGYHWFGDWGRDTLIALPGLTLVTRRFDDAKKILNGLAKYCNNGLIPNAFLDRNSTAVYNTVDASLWYIDRVYQYLKYTNDRSIVAEMWDTLQSIMYGYIKGTDFGIHMDSDFLISHDPGLTWMDVKIDNYYPTPREKKAVEIQALWYNSLRIMSLFSQIMQKNDRYIDLSEKVKDSFNYQFDNFYDVIDEKDTSIRPNQIFLVSLDYSMINKEVQEKIVKDVGNDLVTIFGLRTLSPKDPNYKGSYIGNYNKDIAYHNGTVWPWLLGQYIKAFVKINGYSSTSRSLAFKKYLKPMLNVYGTKWDGSIHEIFDGDPIYSPRGCITQAWSVAEILRTWVEDIKNIKPTFDKFLESPKIRV
jgi:predicted glycogen debranching enzyme